MAKQRAQEPIAIIGLSCRFSGGVDTPDRLWELISESRNGWSTFPPQRINQAAFHHPVPAWSNTNPIGGAHFLQEDISLFDAKFFNMTVEQAAVLDPQIRMQLETTFEAFESAGLTIEQVAGSNTAVFAGIFMRDYYDALMRDPETLPRHFVTSTGATMASARISHFYDLRGPCMTIDTACSTSITAVHEACNSLTLGDAQMAVVTAANVFLNPEIFSQMSATGFLSEDGRSYSFDNRASGYGRGEGIATLILKPLDQALIDNDPVRAVIRSTAINQDGKTPSITSPCMIAQQELIKKCYKRAGLNPKETAYVEAHGTGTKVGDLIESQAIFEVFGKNRPSEDPLYVGSVKSNIGHCEATSGLAGMIKIIMAFEHEKVPPNFDFQNPSSKIPLHRYGIQIPTKSLAWPGHLPRRASINSFGYGGSNGHVILERHDSMAHNKISHTGHKQSTYIFILSGTTRMAVTRQGSRLKDYIGLDKNRQRDETTFLCDLAHTLSRRRSRHVWASVVTASSRTQLIERITGAVSQQYRTRERVRIGFVFTGQGAQWYAMGRELMAYSVFRKSLEEADVLLQEFGCSWHVIEELHRENQSSRIHEPGISLPLCCIVQIALVRLLSSWGVEPTAVTGHSSGEVAAAFAAKAITLREALAIVWNRGHLTEEHQLANRKGGMLAVGMSRKEMQLFLSEQRHGYAIIACVNSPCSVTLSGDIEAIEKLEGELRAQNVFVRRLKVNAAYHCDHMQGSAARYLHRLQQTLLQQGEFGIETFSSSTVGCRIARADTLNAEYWVKNMLQPVEFLDAFTNMCVNSDGHKDVDIVIEIGPHNALAGPIRQILAQPELKQLGIQYTSCLVRDESALTTMFQLVCFLCRQGSYVDLDQVNNGRSGIGPTRTLTDLPKYSWDHEMSHWIEPRINRQHRLREHPVHDLLGARVPGMNPDLPTWRSCIQSSRIPWLQDHKLQSAVVFPAAGYISMAIEALKRLYERKGHPAPGFKIRNTQFLRALMLPGGDSGIEVQLQLRLCNGACTGVCGRQHKFIITSVTGADVWMEHCTGWIIVQDSKSCEVQPWQNQATFRRDTDPRLFYSSLRQLGVHHGPAFQTISRVESDDRGKAMIDVVVKDTASLMPGRHESHYVVHPTILDSIIVSAFAARAGSDQSEEIGMIPHSLKTLQISPHLDIDTGTLLQVHSEIEHMDSTEMIITTQTRISGSDQVLISMEGLSLKSLGPLTLGRKPEQSATEATIVFEPHSLPPVSAERLIPNSSTVAVVYHKSVAPQNWMSKLLEDFRLVSGSTMEHSPLLSCNLNGKDCVFLEMSEAELMNLDAGTYHALQRSLTTAKNVLWISRGAMMNCEHPMSALSQGLLRTLRRENQSKHFINLDLDPNREVWSLAAIEPIVRIYKSLLDGAGRDFEYSERDGMFFVPRLRASSEPILQTTLLERSILSDDLYVVVGGMRGIGKSICRYLARIGAKRLLILSRSAEKHPEKVQEFRSELNAVGCDVLVRNCDITSSSDLTEVLKVIDDGGKSVKGVIQAAMVLKDNIFENMSYEDFNAAVSPKTMGTWNLHQQFAKHELDFFIILSSLVGVCGNIGQANYAAGGAFQDALSRHRASLRLPTLTIDLGAVEGVGYLADHVDIAEQLAKKGFKALNETEVISLVAAGIQQPLRNVENAQIVTGFQNSNVTSAQWAGDARFAALNFGREVEAPLTDAMYAERLTEAKSVDELSSVLVMCLRHKLSDMFAVPEAEIDASKSLAGFGVDSLVAVEIRNWLATLLKADVSIFEVVQSTSLNELASSLSSRSGLSLPLFRA